jgi:hypothetical protein
MQKKMEVPQTAPEEAVKGKGIALAGDSGLETKLSAIRVSARRTVQRNLAREQSLQINAPVGEEGWLEVEDLAIQDNLSTGNSIQVNHAISGTVLQMILDVHSKVTFGMGLEGEKLVSR